MSYTFGQQIALYADTYTDENGDPVDPGTVKCLVQEPGEDGTEAIYEYGVDPELTRISTGKYKLVITPDTAGLWRFRWEGDTQAAEDTFEVASTPFESAG